MKIIRTLAGLLLVVGVVFPVSYTFKELNENSYQEQIGNNLFNLIQ